MEFYHPLEVRPDKETLLFFKTFPLKPRSELQMQRHFNVSLGNCLSAIQIEH